VRRVLVTGTFYNVGWYRSHLPPLSACPVLKRVIVVTDADLPKLDNVVFSRPPRWIGKLLGSTVARILWCSVATLYHRPDVLMGYHIMPNALACLVLARLSGARAIFQLTGGPIQIKGGGVGSENVLLRQLRKHSDFRERLMYHVVRQFDCVVTRGPDAIGFLKQHNLARQSIIIPGSVDCERFIVAKEPAGYDLIAVGRLVPVKRYDRLIKIVVELVKACDDLRVAVVGGGPQLEEMQARAADAGIADRIDFLGQRDDVPALCAASKAFILTSENEGLSIAMLEALAAGLPAIVPDVGDLASVVETGINGMFIDPEDPITSAAQIADLLANEDKLSAWSKAARETALGVSIPAVAERWSQFFDPGHTVNHPTETVPTTVTTKAS
jgi:glycosyltransferase involved in cell wall biosynthesis